MKLSVVIIAKNEALKIGDAIESVKGLADEVIVLDGESTDATLSIARKAGARTIQQKGDNYSDWRNQGAKAARGDWIFYLDADERVTPQLKKEMETEIANPRFSAYAIPRKNIILGYEMRHGGWWPDYVKRLFKKDALKVWKGELHEEPTFTGNIGHFKEPLIHIKHDNLSEMIEKTNKWSVIEAKLLYKSDHPMMSWWRFLRVMFTELWDRLIVKRGFLDGTQGVIYAIYQMWSKFITYGKLWEMQRK
ncbi:MAG: glycosyltransferase family 2 protein [bacterium]|nr:glycosyltransferase family 2 protein [bacterium]